jgi:hypothetical protein
MGLDECKGSVVEVLNSVHEVIDENLSNLVEGVGEVGTSREVSKDSGSNKELNETPEEVKVREKRDELPWLIKELVIVQAIWLIRVWLRQWLYRCC